MINKKLKIKLKKRPGRCVIAGCRALSCPPKPKRSAGGGGGIGGRRGGGGGGGGGGLWQGDLLGVQHVADVERGQVVPGAAGAVQLMGLLALLLRPLASEGPVLAVTLHQLAGQDGEGMCVGR